MGVDRNSNQAGCRAKIAGCRSGNLRQRYLFAGGYTLYSVRVSTPEPTPATQPTGAEPTPARDKPTQRRTATRILRPDVGSLPGALATDSHSRPTQIHITDFSPDTVEEMESATAANIPSFIARNSVTWVDVQGFKDVDSLKQIAQLLRLHPLMLADAINVPQRAKAEQFPEYLFVILLAPKSCDDQFEAEQVALVFNDKFVLSFQEQDDLDSFKAVRDRIRHNRGIIRSRGPAYLAYALLDIVTDNYFPLLEKLEQRLNGLEQRLLKGQLDLLNDLYELRHLCIDVDRAIRHNRDALNTLLHLPAPFMNDEVRTYLRDCLDHALRQEQQAHSLYDFAMSLRELHNSAQTARMNEIIKVLTMVSTIFIPLSFFAGVYGMNFSPDAAGNMPELRSPYAYWIWWGVMLLVVASMLTFFRRRGWLGGNHRPKQ